MTVQELSAELVEVFGPTLVALMTNERDRKLPLRWADGSASPDEFQTKAMEVADDATRTISDAYDFDMTRAWFIGHNDRLDEAPVFAIRNWRFQQVGNAAAAFVEGNIGF